MWYVAAKPPHTTHSTVQQQGTLSSYILKKVSQVFQF